jgi:uncharacterized membrane protein YwaF
MQEVFKLFIGLGVLLLGYPIGIILARFTKEELNPGRKWILLLTLLSLIGGFIGLIIRNDILMFSLFFIAIVSSRSLKFTNKFK